MKEPGIVILNVGKAYDNLRKAYDSSIETEDSLEEICANVVECAMAPVRHYDNIINYVGKVKYDRPTYGSMCGLSQEDFDEHMANSLSMCVGDLGIRVIEQLRTHGFYTRQHQLDYAFVDASRNSLVIRKVDHGPTIFER